MEIKYKQIKDILLNCEEKDPIAILKGVMKCSFINIHGPEHHFLDGASLMVALKNAGLDFDLEQGLDSLALRTIKMPGAMCGYWGVCGSVSSIGAVFAIIDSTGPLSNDENYASHMKLTSSIIEKMSEIGGPRCCKRNAFLSLNASVKYANEKYGLEIPQSIIKCEFSNLNQQCIKERCPFYNGK